MICQECNERPATLHFTKINNGQKTEFHLCEKCAQEKGESAILGSNKGFSINNLLAGLLNIEPTFHATKQEPFYQQNVLQCNQCSMTYQQFIQVGRFGCAHCYEAFSEQLKPILRRLHSGNWTHTGKIPKRIGGNIHLRKELEELKQNLKDLITREEFETAAKVRDQIRYLEGKINESNEGGE